MPKLEGCAFVFIKYLSLIEESLERLEGEYCLTMLHTSLPKPFKPKLLLVARKWYFKNTFRKRNLPLKPGLCRMFSIPDEVLMVIFSEGSIFSKLDQQK